MLPMPLVLLLELAALGVAVAGAALFARGAPPAHSMQLHRVPLSVVLWRNPAPISLAAVTCTGGYLAYSNEFRPLLLLSLVPWLLVSFKYGGVEDD
jgi:hypothetical protein